jgi:hypothetical protein
MEGIDRELIDVCFRYLPEGTEENHEELQDSLWVCPGAKDETPECSIA